jgi:tRNA A-37 threonylcarbamoyl transferase component Bud32
MPAVASASGGRGKDSRFEAGDVIGEFRLVRELGSGGMGVVWEAEQLSVKRRVALKLLWRHSAPDPKWVKRFEREAEASGRLNHPGIVRIIASGEADGIHYMAHELVGDGYTLADSLEETRRDPTLPVGYYERATELLVKIADALHHAHQSRVLHRDVKPSNILISDEDQPKVSDFGLARVEGGLDLSRTGEFMGTPFYMSPEQAAARRMGLDHRTDIFSLGATLYEVMTLERPFTGETSQEIFHKILTVDPSNLRSVRPEISSDLDVICQKAMEKDPDKRYRTMADFRDDLQRTLDNEPIRARPPGAIARGVKWGKRHPRISTGVGVAVFSVVTTLAVVGSLAKFSGMFSGVLPSGAGQEQSRGGLLGALVDLGKVQVREADSERLAAEARALCAAGDDGAALERFEEIAPEYAAAHPDTILPEYALCLWRLGKAEDARQVLKEALRLAEGLPDLDRALLDEAKAIIAPE